MDAADLENLTAVQRKQWGRLCSFVRRLHVDKLVPQRVLLVLMSVSRRLSVRASVVSNLFRANETRYC